MSARQDMFAQIFTDLSAINGSGDYTVKIEKVYEDDTTAIEEFPALVIIRGPDEVVEDRGLQVRILDSEVTIGVVVMCSDVDRSRSALVDEVVTDVILAMTKQANYNHSATCIKTHYVGRDDFVMDDGVRNGSMVRFKMQYRNTWSAP